MELFKKIGEPKFLKCDNDLEKQVAILKELMPSLNAEGQKIIQNDIRAFEYGIQGEKALEFELKNSHIPMYVLHDIHLDYNDLSVQIDYLVFTNEACFIIECKNLYGNIEIDEQGNFVRIMEFNGVTKREGIYSPVTQNQRHYELIKSKIMERCTNFLNRAITENVVNNYYKPIVVLANPKSLLDNKCQKQEIKNKVIRLDNLISYIKDQMKQCKNPVSDKELLDTVQSFLAKNINEEKDYTKKYEQYKTNTTSENIKETPVFKELRQYRMKVSTAENIKPYFVYKDDELISLISRMPKTLEELKSVPGFGDKKVAKYGNDILSILDKHR